MSASWDGRPLPARADTVAARCMDIIERGITRLKLERAPAKFNQVLAIAAPKHRPPAQKGPPALTTEKVVAAWRALPLGRRTVSQLSFDLGRSDEAIRRLLQEAKEPIPTLQKVLAARKAARETVARERVLAAWAKLPPAQRKGETVAREARVSGPRATKILTEAGLMKAKGRARR